MLNARIRKRWRRAACRSALVGAEAALTYDYAHIWAPGPTALQDLIDGKHAFAQVLNGQAADGHRRQRRLGAPGRRRCSLAARRARSPRRC